MEQARRHGMNGIMLRADSASRSDVAVPAVFPAIASAASWTRSRGNREAKADPTCAALGDILDPVGGQQEAYRTVPDQAK